MKLKFSFSFAIVGLALGTVRNKIKIVENTNIAQLSKIFNINSKFRIVLFCVICFLRF